MLLYSVTLLVTIATVTAYDKVEMLCLVNRERNRYGLKNLGGDTRLDNAAQSHCDYQADSSQMTHFGDGDPGTRIQDQDYNWLACAENVAYGYKDEVHAMHSWMNSPGHRANILNRSYTHFGSAVGYSGEGVPYYTQDFAGDGRKHKYPACPSNMEYPNEAYADGGTDDDTSSSNDAGIDQDDSGGITEDDQDSGNSDVWVVGGGGRHGKSHHGKHNNGGGTVWTTWVQW